MPTPGPRRLTALLCALLGLVGLALLLPVAALQGQSGPAQTTPVRPYHDLYLPLLMNVVNGKPFPTSIPPATPTATHTRRPTITPTATATATGSPTLMPTASQTPLPTASQTLAPGVTPSITLTPTPTRTPTVTRTPSPSPSPTPLGRVVVVSQTAFVSPASRQVTVVGEVRNESGQAVENVVVTVALLRDDLLPIASASAEVFAPRLGPGQSAPFRLVTELPDEYDSTAASVTGWTWTTGSVLPPLQAPRQTYQAGGTENALFGLVANSTAAPISQVRVVAVYRNPQGQVVNVVDSGIGTASPYGLTLDPGQTSPFRVPLGVGQTPGAPQYLVLYAPAPSAAPAPLATRAVRSEPIANHADLFGEVQNTTDGPIREVQVIATFYNDADQVVNAAWVWASQNADRILNPGQAVPFQISLDGPTAATWRRYTLQTSHHPAPAPLPTGVGVENTTFRVSLDNQTLDLTGSVVNGSSATLRRPRLVVTVLKNGLVQYTFSEPLTVAEGLAPGGRVDYAFRHNLPWGVGQTLVEGVEVSYAVDFQP